MAVPENETCVENLVVDANAFLRNLKLERIGEKIHTIPEVVSEIRDPGTRQRLQVLPYDLHYLAPTPQALKIVGEFSKKTGDFPSLSAVDLRLLAAVYTLESEDCGGTEHLKKEPDIQISQKLSNYRPQVIDPRSLVGFHIPKEEAATEEKESNTDHHDTFPSEKCEKSNVPPSDKVVENFEKLALSDDSSEPPKSPDFEESERDFL